MTKKRTAWGSLPDGMFLQQPLHRDGQLPQEALDDRTALRKLVLHLDLQDVGGKGHKGEPLEKHTQRKEDCSQSQWFFGWCLMSVQAASTGLNGFVLPSRFAGLEVQCLLNLSSPDNIFLFCVSPALSLGFVLPVALI